MSHKAIKGLCPCQYCGGNGEVRMTRKIPRISRAGIEHGRSYFIRCEKCHARTQAMRDIDNAIAIWKAGNYYPLCK